MNTLLTVRRSISDDPFYLAQLDVNFDAAYERLLQANKGFLRGWYDNSTRYVFVDKNRAWLHSVEYLAALDSKAKVLVCIRELGQIYASIENQHQKTIMLDYVDHLADFDRFGRANLLFAKDKTIGAPLNAVQSIADMPKYIRDKLYFVKYEDLLSKPCAVVDAICTWLGIETLQFDPLKLDVAVCESDSHYRYKYRHVQSRAISALQTHRVPERIQSHIQHAFAWYYDLFYPHFKAPP